MCVCVCWGGNGEVCVCLLGARWLKQGGESRGGLLYRTGTSGLQAAWQREAGRQLTEPSQATHLQHSPWNGVRGEQVRKHLGRVAQLVGLQPASRPDRCWVRGRFGWARSAGSTRCGCRSGSDRLPVERWRRQRAAHVVRNPHTRCSQPAHTLFTTHTHVVRNTHTPVDQLVLLHEAFCEAVGVLATVLAEPLRQQRVVPAVGTKGEGARRADEYTHEHRAEQAGADQAGSLAEIPEAAGGRVLSPRPLLSRELPLT